MPPEMRSVIISAVVFASLACGDGGGVHFRLLANDSALWSPETELKRDTIQLQGRVIWTRWSNPEDSVLLRPFKVRATKSRIFVLDGTGFVTALDTNGDLLWRVGRRGSGPGEFRRVRDLEATPEGGVAVLDTDNARVIVLDSVGTLTESVRLPDTVLAQQVLPLGGGRYLVQTIHAEQMFVVVTEGQSVGAPFGVPWRGTNSLHPLVRQGKVSNLNGADWVFGFGSGNGWFAFRDTTATGLVGHYAEHVEFPHVIQRVSANQVSSRLSTHAVSAQDLCVDGGSLFVLFGGEGRQRFRIVDVFSYSDGAYHRSYVLPEVAIALSVVGSRAYFIAQNEDGYPGLLALSFPDTATNHDSLPKVRAGVSR